MRNFTVSIYLTIEAENEKEAREIAAGLDLVSKSDAGIFWDSLATEVEEESDL